MAAFGDKKEYIAIIEAQLRNARKENSSLTKEKEMKGLQLVWETQKLRETEGKLHRKEQEMARGQKEVSVFKMRLHEMQENLDKAESSCKQQEAQVQLLERELEQQQSLRGPSRRRSTIPHQDSSATSSHSSRDPSTGLSSSRDQQSQSLAGELADCDESVREGKVVVEGGGGGGKEKENRVTKSPKREGRRRSVKLGAISFLEEVEREFEKKASQQAPVKNTQTALYGNRLKGGCCGAPVYPRGTGQGSKANQCPQQ
ncbi:hypothetical protein GBAR_LOCUS27947 [Geodia barretti]|nr:hypothetical protein GBAR_LOCUS27947 [Geodia barretti]